MAEKKSLSARIEELAERFDDFEERLEIARRDQDDEPETPIARPDSQYCALPPVAPREFAPEVSANRVSAILAIGNKWVNRTNLRYFMFDSGPFAGDESQQKVVRQAFKVWKDVGIGLDFTEVSAISEAELRIGFLRNDGSWSVVGTDALEVGQNERTMNFGWNINVPGPNGLPTAIHEIGHALGFKHEHQNPNAGIVWNGEAVYEFFARTQMPPWSRAKTDFNILNTLDPQTVEGTPWDPKSIMHYAFARGLIQKPAEFQGGLTPPGQLSSADIEVVKRFYPEVSAGAVISQLQPFASQRLTLAPGEQQDFNILPAETRDYEIRTFGEADTVVVLFEEEGGSFRYVQGANDSGFDKNASFRARLVRGRKYQLRVRLYYRDSGAETAVMIW